VALFVVLLQLIFPLGRSTAIQKNKAKKKAANAAKKTLPKNA